MSHKNLKKSANSQCLRDKIAFDDIEKAFQHAQDLRVDGDTNYFSYSFAINEVDPLAVLEQHSVSKEFQYYWEKPVDQFAIAAAGSLERIRSTGNSRFRKASQNGKKLINRVHHFSSIQHPKATTHLLGGFSFFDHCVGKDWRDYGAGSFTLPQWVIIKSGKHTILTVSLILPEENNLKNFRSDLYSLLDKLDNLCNAGTYTQKQDHGISTKVDAPGPDSTAYHNWEYAVETATDLIKQEVFDKIVLARDLSVKLDRPVSDTAILHHLRKQYPECYSFLIRQNNQSSFIGCTPERLASFENRNVLTEGLAGSISRGNTASEDARLEFALLHSQKDLNEHNFVIDAIEENLEHFSEIVEHPDTPAIKKLSNVQHLYTPVKARIKQGVSRTEVLEKLHPTPAVGGYPRSQAVPFINRLENFERGWYASPVGWINANGEGEFVVAIRSGLIKKEEVKFFAGCGIVKDSDPKKEWEETNLKFIPMLTALEYARK